MDKESQFVDINKTKSKNIRFWLQSLMFLIAKQKNH